MLFTSSLFGDFVTLLVTIIVILVSYWKWSFNYWKRRNVPSLKPSIPFGNMSRSIRGKEHAGVTIKRIYDEMKSRGWKYGGIYTFTHRSFFPIDLDLVKNIMSKDFQYFMDRGGHVDEKQPLQSHLLNLTGAKWRNMRAKLTPTFTSGKMKMMFNVMAECHGDLQKRMEKERLKGEPINIKEVLACFTTNIIGSCVFGLEFKALEDENSPFRAVGRRLFNTSRRRMFRRTFVTTFPKLARALKLSVVRKELVDFITNLVEDTIKHREENNYRRNDFMQLLIDLMKKEATNSKDHDGKPLTLDEVASQAIVFFAAGFETSSTLMTFTLYQLGKHQDLQDKLRDEMKTVLAKHDNQMTYDSIQDMKYLTQVLDETLRMHPPAPALRRRCVKDYKLPGEDVVIEKGSTVMLSILGIHYDEEYYPEPTKFDPERFSEENRKTRHHSAFIPFGDGPRNCIGMRFGLLQAKVGLVSLLTNYKFTVNGKTKEPLVYRPTSGVLSAEGEIWLDAENI